MASPQWDRNAGITGPNGTALFDLPNYAPKFQVRMRRYKTRAGGQQRERRGRGGGAYSTLRWLLSSGTLALTAEVSTDGWPAPSEFRGASGTIYQKIDTGKYVEIPVEVLEMGFDNDESKQDTPFVVFAVRITGDITYHGFKGTQPTISAPSKSDQIQWVGSSKTIDPDGLNSTATRLIDIWGTLTDSDAAEQTKLLAVISAAAVPLTTPHNAKLRSSTYARDALDGGTITEQWALTTSKEDILNAVTEASDDPSAIQFGIVGIASTAVTAAWNTTPPSPDNGDLVVRFKGKKEYNDSNTLHIWRWGQTTPEQDWKFPRTILDTDLSGITDTEQDGDIQDSATPSLAVPTGWVLRRWRRERLTDSGQYGYVAVYGRVSILNELQFAGMKLKFNTDHALNRVSMVRIINNDDASSATPPNPADYGLAEKVIASDSQQLTTSQGTYDGFWQHDYLIAPNSDYDVIVNEGTQEVDPSTIGDTQTIFDVGDSSTFPSTPTPSNSDLKLTGRSRVRIQEQPEKWKFRWTFGRNTREDEQEHTARGVDPDNFGESERIPVVHTSASSSPGTPSPVNTTQLVGYDVQRLCVANGSFTGLWLWVFMFGPNTRKQSIEQQGGTSTDPQALEDDDVQTKTNTSSSDPGAPAARISGQVLVLTKARKIQNTPEKWEFTYIFGWRTSTGALVAEHTRTMVDMSTIPTESEAMTAERWLVSGGAPSTPTLSGYVLVSKEDFEVKNPLYRLRIYRWGLVTPQQRDENAKTIVIRDPLEGIKDKITARITSTVTNIQTFAGLQLTTNQTIPSYAGSIVTPIRSGVYDVTHEYDFPDIKIHSANNHFFRDEVRGVPEGGITTGVLTPGNVTPADSDAWVRVYFNFGDLLAKSIFIWRTIGSFMIRRVWNVDETDLYTKLFLAIKGHANDATFLGHAVGEVVYAGPSPIYLFSDAGQKRAVIDYEFSVDNWKHFNDGDLPSGRVAVNTGSISSSGYYAASILEDGAICTFPEASDFSGFIT